MKLHLIRHGMTDANEKRLYCGLTDLGISKIGIVSLEKLKEEIEYPVGEYYIVSRLKRTKETLYILYDKRPDEYMADFNEFNFGDFEMKSYEELVLNNTYINWIENYETTFCPNGESRKIFVDRIKDGLNKIKSIEKDIVLISHGGVIATIMELLLPNLKSFYEWQPKCGRGHTIEIKENKTVYIKEI